jgi:predicted glycoside hydrolase/deacetylase ChbG (UPF0249 family)
MKIIINADDFGKSPERNRAIDDSFKKGLICSAGLIVTGKHLGEAVDYIKKGEYIEHVHLHLNFSANLLHEDSDDVPLTEAMRKDSFFCTNGKFTLYKGLPHQSSDIRKWKIVYREIVAQYKKFMEVTDGKGDNKHIDCHLWYNLTYPVSVALNLFTIFHNIKTVRYIGEHQKNINNIVFKRCRILSWNPRVRSIPATNIDYYLSKTELFKDTKIVELYCHPHYKEGVILDDSPSYLKHERRPMIDQIQDLRAIGSVEFVSWEDDI